MDLISS